MIYNLIHEILIKINKIFIVYIDLNLKIVLKTILLKIVTNNKME